MVDPGSISLICRVRGDLAPDPFIEQIVDNRLPCVVKARPRHRLVEMLVVRVNQGAGLVCPRKVECQRAALEKARSEEHTSELQSLMRISYAVFCLKKKNTTKH